MCETTVYPEQDGERQLLMQDVTRLIVTPVGNPDRSDHWVEDYSVATENLLLTAAALGLSSAWVAIYPRPQREAYVRQVLDIPEAWRVLCLTPVGEPAEAKSPRTRYEASNVHNETFRGD